MFQALCKRRNVQIKYDRFANAQTAAAVYNTNRSKADDPIIQPFDFIRDAESAQKKERLDAAKRHCRKVLNIPANTSREKIMEIRGKAIKDLEAAGYSDAEQIFDSCWPHLAAKG
jgi:sarcosine oxidase delta subunit